MRNILFERQLWRQLLMLHITFRACNPESSFLQAPEQRLARWSNKCVVMEQYLISRVQVFLPTLTNLGSIPGRVIPKTLKAVLAACPASCSALIGGCKGGAVHARCCHWLTTTAAFTAKPAAWPTAQASGDGRHRPLGFPKRSTKTQGRIKAY